jgi:LuxR family transcriptional regulator, maltose regulon positive regulatory protein
MIAAGEAGQARELSADHWNGFFNQGRLATVSGWLDALPSAVVVGDPRLCVARAWLALDLGRLDEVEAWIAAAESGIPRSKAGATARAETSVLRTVYRFKIGDVGGAHEAARETITLAPRTATFPRTAAHCILGITLYWSGERDRAAEALGEAARLARSARNDLAASYALGYLSLIRADEADPTGALALASSALELSDEPGFTEHFVMMMAQLGHGRALERLGKPAAAEEAYLRALELGRRGAGRIEIAVALIALADLRHARAALKDARKLLAHARALVVECPDPRSLEETLRASERRLGLRRARSDSPAQDLTDRELSVLRLLETDLSRREIAATLYVSLNTVKTHIRSILRKLGASNRREAVERARALGLLALP